MIEKNEKAEEGKRLVLDYVREMELMLPGNVLKNVSSYDIGDSPEKDEVLINFAKSCEFGEIPSPEKISKIPSESDRIATPSYVLELRIYSEPVKDAFSRE